MSDPGDQSIQQSSTAKQTDSEQPPPDIPDRPKTQSPPAATAQLLKRLQSGFGNAYTYAKARIKPAFDRGGAATAEGGKKSMELSMHMARDKAFPWLARAVAGLREHTRPSVLKRDYRQALLLAHQKLFDRQVEDLTFVSSSKPTPLSDLKIGSITRLQGSDYKPTPRLVFRWAMEAIPEKPENYTFIDFGAGRGRVLLLASHLNFAKIIGVEFAEELHNDCEMNVAQYPRSLMKCRNIECVLDDATHYELPDSPTLFYFFRPFNDAIMAEVLDRIARSYDRSPRRIYLVCIDMPDNKAIENLGIFRRFNLPGMHGLRISLLSPYSVSIYRTAT